MSLASGEAEVDDWEELTKRLAETGLEDKINHAAAEYVRGKIGMSIAFVKRKEADYRMSNNQMKEGECRAWLVRLYQMEDEILKVLHKEWVRK